MAERVQESWTWWEPRSRAAVETFTLDPPCGGATLLDHRRDVTSAREVYAPLWDSLNADRAPWSSNPWVWAISFRRVKS